MKIEKGKSVTLEYELRVDGGQIVESSSQSGPLQYVHGTGKMLPGLERQIEGLAAGQEREGLIMAAEAYGDEDSLPRKTVSRSEFSANDPPEEGKTYQAKGPNGSKVDFTVLQVTEDTVTIRFNHPLAGKDLRYKVKVLRVAEPGQPPPPPID